MTIFKSSLIAGVIAILGSSAFGHGPTPDHDLEAEEQNPVRNFCFMKGARASWGAVSRYVGAPANIIIVPKSKILPWFMAENPPPDGIYVGEEMTLSERKTYVSLLMYGWQQADSWIANGETKKPEGAYLTAVFMEQCKLGLMEDIGNPVPEETEL